MAFGQARGDDADHARVPALGGEHVRSAITEGRDLLLGRKANLALDEPALAVGPVELFGDLRGAGALLGEDQLQARVGAVHAAGRVQARAQREGDRSLVEHARIDARDRHQGAQAGLARPRERSQPASREAAVLSAQRDDIGDRRKGDEVEILLRLLLWPAARLKDGRGQLVGDGRRTQLGARIAANRGMDDRHIREGAIRARGVVV